MSSVRKTVEVFEKVHKGNKLLAEENRARFSGNGLYLVNVLGSPGSGKTTFIDVTQQRLGDHPFAVIEGDVAGDIDTRHFAAQGVPAIQINTGGGCHLDAGMVGRAAAELAPAAGSVVFIENVGNLICTSGFDLGEDLRVLCLSTPEGDDKPIKYPGIFRSAHVLVITKSELAGQVGCDRKALRERAKCLNNDLVVFELSAKTGSGMDTWCEWFTARMEGRSVWTKNI